MHFEKMNLKEHQMIDLIEYIDQIEIKKIKKFKSGWETTNILINDTYVYRFAYISYSNSFYKFAQDLIDNEVKFANYLYDNNINNFKFILFENNYYEKIYLDNGILFILKYDYIVGKECSASKKNIIKIAEKIASFHVIAQRKEIQFIKIDNYVAAMDYRNPEYNIDVSNEIATYKYYYDFYKKNKIKLKNLKVFTKEIFIHNDIKKDNIIIHGNDINFIDFGDCRYSNCSEDIGSFFWGLSYECPNIDYYNDRIQLFLDTYILKNSITSMEIEMIYRYVIDRFLNINLFYLNIHMITGNNEKYRMQVNKFKKEMTYIDYFIKKIGKEEKVSKQVRQFHVLEKAVD